MKTYDVEIKETLRMTVEIKAENAEQAKATVQEAYNNQDYILDAEHFAGVDFCIVGKDIDTRRRNHKHREYER
jgi:hypothetical protein